MGRENVFKRIIAMVLVFRSKFINNAWRLGYTRTRWGSFSAPSDPVAAVSGQGMEHSLRLHSHSSARFDVWRGTGE